ncbi:PleD family two-component system response regulator [Candidatus Omnitrophota bacterium]
MSKRILIADDSTMAIKIVNLALRFKGYAVKVVANGKEALSVLKKEKFDVLVVDLMMPVMDGCELLSRVRNDDRLKDIPAIIVTEAKNEKMKDDALVLGVKDVIVKPFHPTEFIHKVEGLLNEETL